MKTYRVLKAWYCGPEAGQLLKTDRLHKALDSHVELIDVQDSSAFFAEDHIKDIDPPSDIITEGAAEVETNVSVAEEATTAAPVKKQTRRKTAHRKGAINAD